VHMHQCMDVTRAQARVTHSLANAVACTTVASHLHGYRSRVVATIIVLGNVISLHVQRR
jgi:hypothetical protein